MLVYCVYHHPLKIGHVEDNNGKTITDSEYIQELVGDIGKYTNMSSEGGGFVNLGVVEGLSVRPHLIPGTHERCNPKVTNPIMRVEMVSNPPDLSGYDYLKYLENLK